MRILLIDDSSFYRDEFAELLAKAGLAGVVLDHADAAVEGARRMASGEHDIYFVDYRLPGAKGTELIAAARQSGVAQPIICLTGLDNPQLDREAERVGASFHLSKDGLTAELLGRTIRFALRNAAAKPHAADMFRLAQEAANIGAWDWDADSATMTWDARTFQLFGGDLAGAVSAYDLCKRALRPDAFAAVEQAVCSCMETGKPFQTDFEVTWSDGSVHAIRAAGRAMRDANGSAHRVGGLCWDITEIWELVAELARARDVAECANRAKSRFLTSMSHELRTPMNAILGNARLLQREGGLSQAQAARVSNMLGAGAHLLDLIHCALDLSEIETGRVVLRSEPTDLRLLAGDCLGMVRSLVEEKRLALHLAVSGDVPQRIMADPMRLRQILLNLLGNAAKFTKRGGIDLRIRSTACGETLRFDVADTGPGIPADKRQLLFHDFGRLETGIDSVEEGAGLGLALSSRLAALMGAKIGHMDNPGGGSIFWLEMKLIEDASAAAHSVAGLAAADTAPGRRLHVLVVDDSEMNLDVAASFLRVLGHQASCCGSGAEAVAAVAATPFDVVLMDVQMPGMDGLEATRRIRALPGPSGQVPVVALTAQVFTEQVEACQLAGMTGHLAKPFTEASLYASLAAAVPGAPPDRRTAQLSWNQAEAAAPIIDVNIFMANTRLLKPASVVAYLENIAASARALLAELRRWDGSGDIGESVLKAAHKLGGNVGLFGFVRTARAAGCFERAARAGAPGLRALSENLVTDLELSISEVERRLAGVQADH